MVMTNTSGTSPTTNVSELELIELPFSAILFSVVYIAIDLVFGLLSNLLLMVIIYYSPCLRTPPNSHLVNIGVNNILLCVCMIVSIATVAMPYDDIQHVRSLTGFQLFCVTACSLQYLLTFASIGFYRNRTMQRPNLSLKVRKTMVSRSIMLNWVITHLLSLVYTLAFVEEDSEITKTLNPLQMYSYVFTILIFVILLVI